MSDPRGVRPLVHERHCGHRHGPSPHDPDLYGLPGDLFAFEYPAPGAPEVAELVADTVKPRWVGLDRDS